MQMTQKYKGVFSLGAFYAIGTAAEKIQSVIFLPIYMRFLSLEDFGVLALLALLIDLIIKIIISPLTSGLIRFYYRPDWIDKNGILIFNGLLFLCLQCVLAMGIFWHVSPWISDRLFDNQDLVYEVRVYGLILLLRPASTFLNVLTRLREMASYYVAVSVSALTVGTGVILYGLIFEQLGVRAWIYGEISRLIVVTLGGLFIWMKYSTFRISFSVLTQPLRFGYPQALSGYANLLIQSGDRYLLKWLGSVSTVGLYSLGYKIASLMNFILVGPLKQATLPLILKLEKEPDIQKKVLADFAVYYYACAVFICLTLSLFAREVTSLLVPSDDYLACWVIVPIIAFSYVQHGLGNFVGWGIVMKDRPFLISMNIIITAVVNIGLNLIFIPRWGILGAASATLISYLVWNGLRMFFSARLYKLHFDLRRLGMTIIWAGALCFCGLFIAVSDSLFINLGLKFLLLWPYPLLLWFAGFLSEAEKASIKRLLVPLYKRAMQAITQIG